MSNKSATVGYAINMNQKKKKGNITNLIYNIISFKWIINHLDCSNDYKIALLDFMLKTAKCNKIEAFVINL